MKLLLADTPQGHSSFRLEEDAESLDLVSLAPVRGAVVVEGDADRMGDQVTLRATVVATAVADCGRCTESVPLRSTVILKYAAKNRSCSH